MSILSPGGPVPDQGSGLVNSPPDPHEAALASYDSQRQGAEAQLDKLEEADEHLKMIRENLDTLTNLGDEVTSEDLVKVASKMVAGGIPPEEMAATLADAPGGGQALATWVEGHDQRYRAMEDQVEQQLAQARFHLGATSLQHIAGVGMQQVAAQHGAMTAAQAQPQGNALTPNQGSPNV